MRKIKGDVMNKIQIINNVVSVANIFRDQKNKEEISKDVFKALASKYAGKYIIAFTAIGILFLIVFAVIFFGMLLLFSGQYESPYMALGGRPSEIANREIPKDKLDIFIEAGKRYEVNWAILAAIAMKESTMGSYPAGHVSSVGCVGIMQFHPLTWSGWKWKPQAVAERDAIEWGKANPQAPISPEYTKEMGNLPFLTCPQKIIEYGGYGVDADHDGYVDPYNPKDAIFSAAYMLSENLKVSEKSGRSADRRLREVLIQYSGGSEEYANWVIGKAKMYTISELPVMEFMWPVPAQYGRNAITARYNQYSSVHWQSNGGYHTGLDIAAPIGTPIFALFDGVVTDSGYWGGYGYMIQYRSMADEAFILCAHLNQKATYVAGQSISKGDVIGYVGNTGYSTGPHLHIEVKYRGKRIDPLDVLQIPGEGNRNQEWIDLTGDESWLEERVNR